MSDFKRYKHIEKQLHQMLWENLNLLFKKFPPNNDFIKLATERMLERPNRAAFNELIHYFISNLAALTGKELKLVWPLLDSRQEAEFRVQLVACIEKLDYCYPEIKFTKCQPSMFVSPGGFKFVELVFKLSQIMINEVVTERPYAPLMRGRLHDKVEIQRFQSDTIQRYTEFVQEKTEFTKKHYYEDVQQAELLANNIANKLGVVNEDIKTFSVRLDKLNEDNVESGVKYLEDAEDIQATLKDVQPKLEKLVQMLNHLRTLKLLDSTQSNLNDYLEDLLKRFVKKSMEIPRLSSTTHEVDQQLNQLLQQNKEFMQNSYVEECQMFRETLKEFQRPI